MGVQVKMEWGLETIIEYMCVWKCHSVFYNWMITIDLKIIQQMWAFYTVRGYLA